MRRLYVLLLHFHDPELRAEMLDVFVHRAADERSCGRLSYLWFCWVEARDLTPPQPWIAAVMIGFCLCLLSVSGQGEPVETFAGYDSHLLRGPCAAAVPMQHPRELVRWDCEASWSR